MARRKRVGISTGGGDCPGLNAVIRGVVRSAIKYHGWEVFGIEDGLEGLMDLDYRSPHGNRWLGLQDVRNILNEGGTIIGTSNRSNPFQYAVKDEETGEMAEEDRSSVLKMHYDQVGLDALIMVGGDGTMDIAHRIYTQLGIPVVGVPKTIDNDLGATDYTFGFDTAVNTAAEALDRVHTTAASHDRVMLVEVMGRHAGFIALHAGLAGDADIILLPEMPYSVDTIVQRLEARKAKGSVYTVIVVSEGAHPQDGEVSTLGPREAGAAVRLGGAGERLAAQLKDRIEQEIRVVVLGHIQRGGSPTAFDRILGTRYGVAAMDLVAEGKFGRMVALKGLEIQDVAIEDAVGHDKRVDPAGELVHQARRSGVSFGTSDERDA